jgi:hypothetical protein
MLFSGNINHLKQKCKYKQELITNKTINYNAAQFEIIKFGQNFLGGPQHLKLMHKDVQPPASVYLQH